MFTYLSTPLYCLLFTLCAGNDLFGAQVSTKLLATSEAQPLEIPLDGPRKYLEVDFKLQQGEATSDGWNWTQLGEAVGPVLLFPGISLQEVGVFDLVNLNLTESAPLRLLFLTNSAYPLGLEIATYELALAETFQILIGALLLVLVYSLIVFDLIHRTIAAMVGAALVLVALTVLRERPAMAVVVGWVDEGTIGLLMGMMIIVGVFGSTGFFEWLAVKAFRLSKGKAWRLLVILSLFTAVLSAFLDNVTCILLIVPVTLRLAKVVELDPMPLVLAEVFLANLGGTATMIGDPPNILIGSMLGDYLNFADFLINLAPALTLGVLFCSAAVLGLLRFQFRHSLVDRPYDQEIIDDLELEYVIKDRPLLWKCIGVLLGVIVMFFLERVTHVEPALSALGGAVLLLLITSHKEIEKFVEKVEWTTLLFFAALFIFIEGLKQLGLIRAIGGGVARLVELAPLEHRLAVALMLLVWISALVSAFIDNIPYTATMVPVALQLSQDLALPLKPLVWALSFGACFGGNATIIGASANVVATGVARQAGYQMTFKKFASHGTPVVLLSVTVASVYLLVVYVALGWGHQ